MSTQMKPGDVLEGATIDELFDWLDSAESELWDAMEENNETRATKYRIWATAVYNEVKQRDIDRTKRDNDTIHKMPIQIGHVDR